ncbi:LysR substrate-binding domain-containing protein [Oceanobacillus alkalisoli]|uniref:LysR substrate-binding domain-containing protein n=1 Tax=Oceanobacillus alkalisoli TaxID=2925113 RepID=UPI001EE4B971|nr:LysR substrate-binding domain-containing protein [Oceanobacillus alkalisoli]
MKFINHNNYPNVELTMKTGVNNDLIRDILNRKLDGAFVTGFGNHPDIEQIEVFKEELVLIADNKKVSYDSLKK